MGISLIAHTSIGGPDPLTTTGINTAGATSLSVAVCNLTQRLAYTITDSYNNNWNLVGYQAYGATGLIYEAHNSSGGALVTGPGHTVTVTRQGGSNTYPSVFFSAWSSTKTNTVSPVDQVNQTSHNYTGSSLAVGPITPTASNCLVFAICATIDVSITGVNSGFTVIDSLAPVALNNAGGMTAYGLLAVPAAVTPTFTFSGASSTGAIGIIYDMLPAPLSASVPYLTLLGVQ